MAHLIVNDANGNPITVGSKVDNIGYVGEWTITHIRKRRYMPGFLVRVLSPNETHAGWVEDFTVRAI